MLVGSLSTSFRPLIFQSVSPRFTLEIRSVSDLFFNHNVRRQSSTQAVDGKINNEDIQLVYYDLETTGLKKPVEIVQLAAHVDVTNKWSAYVKPRKQIEQGATKITGLYMENGRLLRNGQPLATVTLQKVLHGFLNFLSCQNKPVVLVGHNIGCYDNGILLNSLKMLDMVKQFQKMNIVGYVDTLRMFRSERRGLGGYSQQKLVERYLAVGYDVHEATADVEILKKLVDQQFEGRDLFYNYIRPLPFA